MLPTRTVWNGLSDLAKGLKVFADVRPYPAHRLNDMAFLKDFPGLALPACLVVRLGRQDTAKGQAMERVTDWSFVIVCKDAAGDAWQDAVDLEDGVTGLLDKLILNDQVELNGSNSVSIAFANTRFAVHEIAATTRELATR